MAPRAATLPIGVSPGRLTSPPPRVAWKVMEPSAVVRRMPEGAVKTTPPGVTVSVPAVDRARGGGSPSSPAHQNG